MTEYNFEYSDRSLSLKIFLLSVAIVLALLVWFLYERFFMAAFISLILMIAFPIFILWLNRKRIKINGTACVYENSVALKLKNFNETIQFGDIKSYMVLVSQGLMIRFRLSDGRKVRIDANNNFCNPEQLGFFCDDLEKVFKQVQVVREKSFFEKKRTYYFLVTMTILITGLAVAYLILGKGHLPSIFMSAFAIATLWTSYYSTKQRNNRQVNSKDSTF